MINYFGKVKGVDQKMIVRPLIFSKGTTFVNIYGISYMKDKWFNKSL